MSRILEIRMLAILAAVAPLTGLAAEPATDPGVQALALLEVAREQGLEPRLVDVRWDPDRKKLHCLVAADDFPLEKATPFLLMADGRSTISREEVGRRIEFPVGAGDFRPRLGPGAIDALGASLDELDGSEKSLSSLPGGGGLRLRLRVPEERVRELFLRASQIEGRAAWARVRLELLEGKQARVELAGPGVPSAPAVAMDAEGELPPSP